VGERSDVPAPVIVGVISRTVVLRTRRSSCEFQVLRALAVDGGLVALGQLRRLDRPLIAELPT
jgi:hypothetical protein